MPADMPSTDAQRIRPLPPDAIAQIHSAKHITSLQGVILSLLENSLDADSTKVDIIVDWKRGSCTVEDNGIGIASEEFSEDGGLGKMYCTSKSSPASLQLHGSSGTFLAKLSSMCLLTIESTHSSNAQSASIALHMSQLVTRRLPDTYSHSKSASRPGTHVTVHDLFGNMPVRLKHRALTTEQGSSSDVSWQELTRGVVALLLAWPKPCSVKLRDADSSTRLVNISGLHSNTVPELTSKSLRRLDGRTTSTPAYDPLDILPILFQSGFASPVSRTSWVPLSANTTTITLKGLISLEPVPTKQCQFLSLGVVPCDSADGHGEWYECVNRIFANSSFGTVEGNVSRPNSAAIKEDRITRHTAIAKPRKGVDRYPMFCLQLTFNESRARTRNFAKLNEASLIVVEDVLEAAVTAWLETHHFRPRKRKAGRRRNEEQESPARVVSSGMGRGSKVISLPGTPASAGTTPVERTIDGSAAQRSAFDVFGRPVSHDAIAIPTGSDTRELQALSRMRSGRPRSGVQSSREYPVHRPKEDTRPATAKDSQNQQKRRRLQAPAIEVGQYSGPRSREIRRSPPPHPQSRPQETHIQERPFHISDLSQTNILSSEDYGSIDSADLLDFANHLESGVGHEAGDTIPWTDPATGQVHRVNSRTGIVLPPTKDSLVRPNSVPTRENLTALDIGSISSAGRPLSLSRRSALSTRPSAADNRGLEATHSKEKAEWLPGFLDEWNNPVFGLRKEPPIPVASHAGPGLLLASNESKHGSHHACHSHTDDAGLHSKDKAVALSRLALRKARVISQVDRKFILAVLPATKTIHVSDSEQSEADTLILIDQHAASERVMLEELLEDLCTTADLSSSDTVTTVPLQPTMEFDVPESEHTVLEKHRAWFLRWGVIFQFSSAHTASPVSRSLHSFLDTTNGQDCEELPLEELGQSTLRTSNRRSNQNKRNSNEVRLRITHLPPCIAARCQKEPRLAVEMVRSEVWRVAEEGAPVGTKIGRADAEMTTNEHAAMDDTPTWLSLLPLIPPSILSLLHSRACRSAIMFNDALSLSACEDLVEKLAACVFPFVCAHGRVGVVPVGVLDGKEGDASMLNSRPGGDNKDEAHIGGQGEKLGAWMRARKESDRVED